MIGDKELQRMLQRLPDRAQVKAVKPALRLAAKRIHPEIVKRVPVDTGRLKAAVEAEARPILLKRSKRSTMIGYLLGLPRREVIGIPLGEEGTKNYYPAFVEYGYTTKDGRTAAPRSYIRAAVDENIEHLHSTLARDINKGIIKQMRRLAKK
jgi:hypothetical protein